VTFLLGILRELRVAHLVRSYRGRGAGFALARSPEAITIADVIRAVDGPLANVRGLSPDELTYRGSAAPLREVWFAVRGSLREVLEQVTLADLVRTELPANVRFWAARYTAEQVERGWTASVS
jgi:Rrf2 family protein